MAHEPLRVSLQDLHSADTKGKWWLVGAAWGGDPLVDRRETGPTVVQVDSDNTLLKLARKQGMNTDIRRSIFVVLMSSDASQPVFPYPSLLHLLGLRRCLRTTLTTQSYRDTTTRNRSCLIALLRKREWHFGNASLCYTKSPRKKCIIHTML